MKAEMKVKILKPFPSPLTNKMTAAGEVINVPKSQFWLKRIQQKDVEEVKNVTKAKAPKADVKNKEKGSK